MASTWHIGGLIPSPSSSPVGGGARPGSGADDLVQKAKSHERTLSDRSPCHIYGAKGSLCCVEKKKVEGSQGNVGKRVFIIVTQE